MVTGESQRLLADRYRLCAIIGRGGMGAVWRARDEMLNRDVAVKEIVWPPQMDQAEREIARRRAVREAQLAARLRHPNVVGVYDIVEEDDRPSIVMELVPFRSLRDAVIEDGPMSPAQAARVGLSVLAALRAVHEAGVVHRDVKPANILLGPEGRVVLTDFGIAKAADSPALTISGVLLGSPSYLAPERARGGRASPASDLWALGASLYAAVEGRPPFGRDDVLASLTAVVADEPDPPVHAGPLWPVIDGLLRKDPGTRLDAAEAEQMLHRIAAEDNLVHPGGAEAATAAVLPADEAAPPEQPPHPPAEALPRAKAGTHHPPDGPALPAPRQAGGALRRARGRTRPGDSRRFRRFRVGWAALAAVAAIAVIAAGIAMVFSRPPTHQAAQGTSSRASGRASGSSSARAAPAPSSLSTPASAPSPSSTTTPGSSGPNTLPAGYYWFTNPTGFSIGVPRDWQISHVGHYVYIVDPVNSGIFLLIDQSDQPKPNPLADWQQQAANRQGTYPDYHLILLRAVRYTQAEKAADWEFTYNRNGVMVQVLNRNILANAQHAYALYWSTPVSDWHAYYHFFQVFAATFRPA
ncbi:MAG TPA: serine/threonine-protein kinase, partial [Streptosporangiaceae bacterium]